MKDGIQQYYGKCRLQRFRSLTHTGAKNQDMCCLDFDLFLSFFKQRKCYRFNVTVDVLSFQISDSHDDLIIEC